MTITPAFHSALGGIKQGLQEMNKDAAKIASKEAFESANPTDIAGPLVDMTIQKLQIEASAKAIKILDETLGSIIDVKA